MVTSDTTEQLVQTLSQMSFDDLFDEAPEFLAPELGSLLEGKVVDIAKNRILVDLNGALTGIISGKEARDSSDTAHTLQKGDTVYATVIEIENLDGLVVLSLRRASKERTWKKFVKAYENKEVINVRSNEANKGGLLLEVDGIKGFIPVSQLAPLHYPRVNGADSVQILARLEKLVGEKFDVRIISIDKENGKLVLSEKAAQEEVRKKAMSKLKVGERVKGVVSGVVKFGIFVAFDGLEGLVHISEIAWGHVKNPRDYAKLGDKIDVMIIGIEKDKISLSMKRLVADPWADVVKKFPVGTLVEGEVNRITPFGAFVKLTEDINGLVHTSEIDGGKEGMDISTVLSIGQKIKAKVINVDLDEHRIGLSLKTKDVDEKSEKKRKNSDHQDMRSEVKDHESAGLEILKENGVTAKTIAILEKNGFNSVDDLAVSKEKLLELPGLGEKTVEKILAILKK